MTAQAEILAVLDNYPPDYHARRIEPLGSAGGFSGSKLWRLDTPRGELCLRLWPAEHPSRQRLEFIHAVLRHVFAEDFRRLPLPIASLTGATYIELNDRLWELAPWMPGEIDPTPRTSPRAAGLIPAVRPARVASALQTLAEFHLAAATFPFTEARFGPSPGLNDRRDRLEKLIAGEIDQLERCLGHRIWPELSERGRGYLPLFRRAAPAVRPLLTHAAAIPVPLQPCLRDIWRENVLFVDDEVSAILDFAAMRVDNVAGDIARLLASFAIPDEELWNTGLTAYQNVRPLSDVEQTLITAFDRTSALMTGISWLDWVFRQHREFADPTAVLQRFDVALARLNSLNPIA
jgi:Ser/Thr protein kinase RdoA (MazF antagonist)